MPLSVLKIRHSNIGCWHWVPIYPELLPSKIKDICWEFSVSVINVCFCFSLTPVFFRHCAHAERSMRRSLRKRRKSNNPSTYFDEIYIYTSLSPLRPVNTSRNSNFLLPRTHPYLSSKYYVLFSERTTHFPPLIILQLTA